MGSLMREAKLLFNVNDSGSQFAQHDQSEPAICGHFGPLITRHCGNADSRKAGYTATSINRGAHLPTHQLYISIISEPGE